MASKCVLGVSVLVTLVLSACGGSGGTSATPLAPSLNAFEQELVGTYELLDFALIQPGEGGSRAEDYEEFAGELVLEQSGRARLQLDLCRDGAERQSGCDREFLWSADAGWIFLDAVDASGSDAMAAWKYGALGRLDTEFRAPMNRPECGQILVRDGFEVYTWEARN